MPDEREDDEQQEPGLRAFWSGTITFGLVSVPVDLFAANRPLHVALRMLAPDGTPLRREYVCSQDGQPLEADDIVRGYEVADGQWVHVSDEELDALEPRKSRDIDLRRFVPRAAIAPAFFQRAYFLAPSGESTKAYRLLAETMERSGRAGIATFVMRGKEYLVAILAEGGILRAETLRFADELRRPDQVGLPEPEEPERGAVRRLVAAMKDLAAEALDPKELRDEQARALLALAARKRAEGQDVAEVPEEQAAPEGRVIDIMEVLKRSVASARAGGKKGAASRGAPGKKELLERARALDIPGRSKMDRDQLAAAIEKAEREAA